MNKQASSERIVTQRVAVSVPSPDSERRMEIRCADWERIKSAIYEVSHPISWLSRASSIFFGISGTAGLSIIPLTSSQGLPPWVIPTYICSLVFTLILGVVFLVLDRQGRARRKSDLLKIKKDMESIESGLQTKGTAS